MPELSTLDAVNQPDQANLLVRQILNEDTPTPEAYPLHITLPGGWMDPSGVLQSTAEIKELTGIDEEVMQRAMPRAAQSDWTPMFRAIVERGTVTVGTHRMSPMILNELYWGDRDALLVAIRIATYGHEYETTINCPKCGRDSEVAFDLNTDVVTHKLANPGQVWRTVKLRKDRRAEIHLVTVADQAAALVNPDLTGAERNTILLGRCVRAIDGMVVLGEQTMQELGAADRLILQKYLTDQAPGPRMGEVVVACPKCKEESTMALSMPALFLPS